MDISDIVTADFVQYSPDDRASSLAGTFEDPGVPGVVVVGETYEGVVTRRQLATTRHPPEATVGSLARPVARTEPRDDVREVARLMVEGDTDLLPVFEGRDLVGVVTVDSVLRAVLPSLGSVTVADAATHDLTTVGPDATAAEALARLREDHIAHLPVVEDGSVVGILSLYDLVDVTVTARHRPQGGDPGAGGGRSPSGGFGAREGERDRLLALPVRDLMVSPVRMIGPEATLAAAVEAMFETGGSSVVVVEDDQPAGILTTTDVLDALTWERAGNRPVQLYGADLVDDLTYDDIVAMVDGIEAMDDDVRVIDARVHLHEHDETTRGTPLLLARVRLDTDRGLFVAAGEGYGASQAIADARDALARQVRDRKTHGRTKKHPDADYWERRFGWLLEG
jgi:CBS domain-containing protein